MIKPTKPSLVHGKYEKAMRYLTRGDYSVAYSVFKELHSTCPESFDPGILELRIGTCCYQLGKEDSSKASEAVEYLKQSYALLDRKGRRFETMGTFDILGMTLWMLSRTHEALLYMEEGLQYLDEYEPRGSSPSDRELLLFDRATYLLLLGDCYFYDSRYDEALASYDSAGVEIRRMSHTDNLTAELLLRIGRAHHYSGNDHLAVENLSQVIPANLSPGAIGYFRFVMLRLHVGKKEYREAIEQFKDLEKVGIPSALEAFAYHFGGIAHYVIGQNRAAKLLFQKAMKFPGPDWISQRSIEYLRKIPVEAE